jgi:hypothetical protein
MDSSAGVIHCAHSTRIAVQTHATTVQTAPHLPRLFFQLYLTAVSRHAVGYLLMSLASAAGAINFACSSTIAATTPATNADFATHRRRLLSLLVKSRSVALLNVVPMLQTSTVTCAGATLFVPYSTIAARTPVPSAHCASSRQPQKFNVILGRLNSLLQLKLMIHGLRK